MNSLKLSLQDSIDLLAEGELDSDSRDRLLVRLDSDPNGWKQCAIALLEQRALQQSMRGPLTNCSLPSLNVKIASTETWQIPVWQGLVGFAAMAIFLIALGWVAGEWTGSRYRLASSNGSNDHPANPSATAMLQSDDDLIRQVGLALESTGTDDAELIAMVRVGDELNRKFYPIVRSNELAQKITAMPKPRLSSETARRLQHSGWELNKHQQFISFKLPNGITKALPVDMLTYRFVGRETF